MVNEDAPNSTLFVNKNRKKYLFSSEYNCLVQWSDIMISTVHNKHETTLNSNIRNQHFSSSERKAQVMH